MGMQLIMRMQTAVSNYMVDAMQLLGKFWGFIGLTRDCFVDFKMKFYGSYTTSDSNAENES